ncbi:MAG: hypothetical protein HY720_03840 [Planctomycetes bacterium]|nr:hypothetical protein [Planctomycetota bacterium]
MARGGSKGKDDGTLADRLDGLTERTVTLSTRLSEVEGEAVRAAGAALGLSTSTYLRAAALSLAARVGVAPGGSEGFAARVRELAAEVLGAGFPTVPVAAREEAIRAALAPARKGRTR